MKKAIVVLVLSMAFFLFPLSLACDYYIDSCSVLEQPGTYCLSQDITDSPELYSCIDIKENNIVLDCRGHSINGFWSYTILIYRDIETRNITIKNCVLTTEYGFTESGIFIKNVSNATIKNNYFSAFVMGSDIHQSRFINFINNTFFEVDYGIFIQDSSNISIINNKLISTSYEGIYMVNVDSSKIVNNTIMDFSIRGIHIYGKGNSVVGNIIYNGETGVELYDTLNIIYNNKFFDTTTGIIIFGNNCSIYSNIIYRNNYGIKLEGTQCSIHSNILEENEVGISIFSPNNKIYNNLFNNTVNVLISDSIVNYFNTTRKAGKRIFSVGDLGGNYWVGFSDVCDDKNRDRFCDEFYVINENNIDYLPYSKYFILKLSDLGFGSIIVIMSLIGVVLFVTKALVFSPEDWKEMLITMIVIVVVCYLLVWFVSSIV